MKIAEGLGDMMGQFRSLGNLCTAAKARGDTKLARSYWEKQQLCRPATQQQHHFSIFSDVKLSPGLARARTEPEAPPGPAKPDAPAEAIPELITDEAWVDSDGPSSSEPAPDHPDAAGDDVSLATPSLDAAEDAPSPNDADLGFSAAADAANSAPPGLAVGPESDLFTSAGDVNALSIEPAGASAALATPGNPFSDADAEPQIAAVFAPSALLAAAGNPFSDGSDADAAPNGQMPVVLGASGNPFGITDGANDPEESTPAPVSPLAAPGSPFGPVEVLDTQAAAVSAEASCDPEGSLAASLGAPGNPFGGGEVEASTQDSADTLGRFCATNDGTLPAVEPSTEGRAPGNPFGTSPVSQATPPQSMSPKAATTVKGYTIASANSFEDFF